MEWGLLVGIAGLVLAVLFFLAGLILKVKFGGSLIFLIFLFLVSAFMVARSVGLL